ncbi:hypothetical protein BD560DRAFT_447377 [Blakeslea trispora]|nr:hypothetical protein BD560DRAFT_447377 [Blakeslea trispora]
MDLRQEAQELKDLVAKIRKEAKLLPTPAKRPLEDTKEEEKQVKIIKTVWDDTAGLMTRLKTFTTLYHCAPRPMSALEAAKHGWQHKSTQEDTTALLLCMDCQRTMYVIDLPTQYQHKPEAIKTIQYYQKGLFECHLETCPWRYHACKDTTYTFPFTTLLEGLDRLQNQARLFVTASQQNQQPIPLLKHTLTPDILKKLKFVVTQFEKEDKVEDCLDGYLLSLFGWSVLHTDLPGIQCDLCFSQRGFFQSDQLDLLEEHKAYCPWRKASKEEQSGYEWMLSILLMEYSLLIKRQDLSLQSDYERNERLYRLKQTITQSQHTLSQWQARIDAVSKRKEL